MVEAPGVEGRGGTRGFVPCRDGSGGKLQERERSNGEASTVSRGDVEARCSTGGSGLADEPLRAPPAQLAALEHLLDAVLVLLEAGEVGQGDGVAARAARL